MIYFDITSKQGEIFMFIAIVINMFRLAEEHATVKIPLSPFRKGGT
jgi:hypothetical protein